MVSVPGPEISISTWLAGFVYTRTGVLVSVLTVASKTCLVDDNPWKITTTLLAALCSQCMLCILPEVV